MFEDIEIEKNKFYHHKTAIFLKDVEIEKKKEAVNTSLVTCLMVTKLNHY